MSLSHRLSLVAVVILTASSNAYTQASDTRNEPAGSEARNRLVAKIETRDSLVARRETLRVELAEVEYKLAFRKYSTGMAPMSDVLNAARELLLRQLAAGTPKAGMNYEKRIRDLEQIASQALKRGRGTANELEMVQAARLDSVLNELLLDCPPSTNRG